jgi:hypothetical protein
LMRDKKHVYHGMVILDKQKLSLPNTSRFK